MEFSRAGENDFHCSRSIERRIFFEGDELSKIFFKFLQVAVLERHTHEIQVINEGALGVVFPRAFQRRRGHHINFYLPAVFIREILDVLERFLVGGIKSIATALHPVIGLL